MSVLRILQERYVIPMVCGRCSHAWNYTGKNPYLATCPFCRTKLSIKKHSVQALQTGDSSRSPQSVAAQKPNGSDSNG
jgi:hypothetical protein